MYTRLIERNFGLCLRLCVSSLNGSYSVDSEDGRMIDEISKATIVMVVTKKPLMILFASVMDTRCVTNREVRKLISKVACYIL